MADQSGYPALAIPPLVGRERELAALRNALAAVLAGRGSLVLIGGEAGIGKTALAEVLAQKAVGRGALVLVGRCYDLTETPPYGPWVEALAQAPRDDASADPPDLGGSNGAPSQAALFTAARDFLATLATRRPLVVLLDDLHWADPASLDLLRFLGRQLADLPLLLLATYRADELTRRHPLYALLPVLEREAHARRLDLRRFDAEGVRALVAAQHALPEADAARLVTWLLGRAEGNAFFTAQLLRALEDEGALAWGNAGWALGNLAAVGLPAPLRQVLDARLGRLGEEAQRQLALAAVIGQEVPLALWATVAETDEDGLLDTIERAVDARLLAESPDGQSVCFVHALIREALYDRTLATRRRRAHRRVGEALGSPTGPASGPPDPDAVAYHFQRAGDARALEWLIAAGERAQRAYAWDTATAHYEAALALLGAGEGEVGRRILLLRRLAQASFGRAPDRGVALLEEATRLAADLGDGGLAAVLRCELGMVRGGSVRAGAVRRSTRELAEGVAALAALPTEVRRRLVGEAQLGGAADGDFYRALLVLRLGATGSFAAALAQGEPLAADWAAGADASDVARGHAYSGLAAAYAAFGRPDEARAAAAASYDAYAAAGHQLQAIFTALRDLVWRCLPYTADDRAAREGLEGRLERARARLAEPPPLWPTGERAPVLLFLEGDWAGAYRLALASTREAHEGGRRWAAWVLGPLAHAQGDAALAWRLVREVLPAGPDTAPDDAYSLLSDLGLLRLAAALATDEGDLPAARAWLACHDRWLAWSGAVLGRAEGALGRAACHRAAGDLPRAREHAEAALTHATAPRQPLALLAARRLLGELDTVEGRHAAARAHLGAALGLAEACAAPYGRALTLLALTELSAAERQPAAAGALVDEARVLLAPLGAAPALARADALAAHGTVSPPVAAAGDLPFGLTAREAAVLALLAEGLTDAQIAARLFISRHTVNGHTRAIYGKLGVTSRAAATRLALDHDLR